MTARAPPPAPDWPASCGAAAAAGREGGGAEQGADCLPASPPQRPLGSCKNTENRSRPRESWLSGGALSMLSRVLPAREARVLLRRALNLPSQAQAGLAAAPCRPGQRTLNPGSEASPGRGGAGHRRGVRALIQGASGTKAGEWGTPRGLSSVRTVRISLC